MEDLKIVDIKEERVNSLIQLLAVLIRRVGGEVVIDQGEFAMMEGVSIEGLHLTPERLVLRVNDFYCEDCDGSCLGHDFNEGDIE